jgi:transketolase
MDITAAIHAKAIELTKLAIEMTTAAGSGHPTSAASLAHLVTVLMYNHMRYDPKQPTLNSADRLVLSEGHACPIIYAAAADLGMTIGRTADTQRAMTREDALQLRDIQSEIDGHPNPAEGFPFFAAATGSLGQGLSVAAGLALAARLDGSDQRIFCLIGDGESREGQIWEAVDFIVDQRLTAVCPIFNCNGHGQNRAVSRQQSPEVTADKLLTAGFEVHLIDGHDPDAITKALKSHTERHLSEDANPMAIVAKTIKGWGFTEVLGSDVHGKPVPDDDVERALAALDQTAAELGAQPVSDSLFMPSLASEASPPQAPQQVVRSFEQALAQFGHDDVIASGQFATRKAYGVALQALGHANPQVVALDGDVYNSTYAEDFANDPDLTHRFFDCRIAEQHMVSCAGGLAAGGKLPFVSTFGKFLTRGYDQLEMNLVSRLNVKYVGSHTGVSLASDGPSQMALPDVAFFRALSTVLDPEGNPMMYVLHPADAYAAYALTLAMAAHDGPCYLRTGRPDVAFLYQDTTPFTLGGHQVLIEGQALLIVAAGYMVHEAKAAVERLRAEGVDATLVDLYSLPFDADALRQLARQNQGRVLTVEDNYGASLGAAVAECLVSHVDDVALRQMYVRQIPKSGRTPDDVLRYLGLSADDICRAALGMLQPSANHVRA